ncbi:peptidase A2 domain-containing protein [Caerostris darwini]|uniref:Peptidase A2 domain-containing protein n=1 Tax=Caerostris darwini TaxID=1538125 RepID=A0AAV4PEV5_9ARAC|nr:hypothetical protein CDAR_178681 [Caerostris darwini]GIX95149.1 peptidase A2 domain-containing protein [Caerostris darwini]
MTESSESGAQQVARVAVKESKSRHMVSTNGMPIHASWSNYRDCKISPCGFRLTNGRASCDLEAQRLRDLISGMQLGDRRPSRFLLEMRSKEDARINDDLLKSSFLPRLPTNVQQILAISNDNLDKLSEMADGIMSTSSAPPVHETSQEVVIKNVLQADPDKLRILITAGTTGSSNNEQQNVDPHVLTRRKTSSAVIQKKDGARRRGDDEVMIQRLYLIDKTSSSRNLIDTGDDVSVVPHSAHKTSCADTIICCEWNRDPNVW